MKLIIRILSVSLALLATLSCNEHETNSCAIASILGDAASSGRYLYGHQDALPYGHGWVADQTGPFDRCDVRDVCGDFPAIAGFDLGGIELGNSSNLDGVPFELMRAAAQEFAARGGILTFSWHIRNPLTGGDSWDVSSDESVQSVLEGGRSHESFMLWLKRLADFLESVKGPDGKPVECIFRPWHENTGSWFWWGLDLCSAEDYKALWRLTYDYLHNERGLDNLMWAYSPGSTNLKEASMDRYPGDKIVDIIGVDNYDGGNDTEVHQSFVEGLRADLEFLSGVAEEHGLLLAVTETGLESIPCPTWWTEALQPALEGFPVCYVLTWRNAFDRPEHFFGPWSGAVCEDDFRAFHDSEKTLFLNEI